MKIRELFSSLFALANLMNLGTALGPLLQKNNQTEADQNNSIAAINNATDYSIPLPSTDFPEQVQELLTSIVHIATQEKTAPKPLTPKAAKQRTKIYQENLQLAVKAFAKLTNKNIDSLSADIEYIVKNLHPSLLYTPPPHWPSNYALYYPTVVLISIYQNTHSKNAKLDNLDSALRHYQRHTKEPFSVIIPLDAMTNFEQSREYFLDTIASMLFAVNSNRKTKDQLDASPSWKGQTREYFLKLCMLNAINALEKMNSRPVAKKSKGNPAGLNLFMKLFQVYSAEVAQPPKIEKRGITLDEPLTLLTRAFFTMVDKYYLHSTVSESTQITHLIESLPDVAMENMLTYIIVDINYFIQHPSVELKQFVTDLFQGIVRSNPQKYKANVDIAEKFPQLLGLSNEALAAKPTPIAAAQQAPEVKPPPLAQKI